MSIRHCVAVDLGASSGRVMLASYQPGPRALTLREIHRFTNSLQKVDGFDCWDVDSLEPRFYVSTSKSIIKALINMHSFEIQLSPIG